MNGAQGHGDFGCRMQGYLEGPDPTALTGRFALALDLCRRAVDLYRPAVSDPIRLRRCVRWSAKHLGMEPAAIGQLGAPLLMVLGTLHEK
jgi:hypothetical protein